MFPGEQPLTQEATERLEAINEFQELGSGMRVAMRDLEIRGAGSLMGAEQHGNLSSVGFDLFTQMLAEAVSEAKGETGEELATSEVNINLPADFFLAEEYLPEVDQRVLVYRKLAYAQELAEVDELEQDCVQAHGSLPVAACNLFDRARIRIRAQRLGVTSVALTSGRLMYQGLSCNRDLTLKFKERGAIVYPKSKKVAYPFKKRVLKIWCRVH